MADARKAKASPGERKSPVLLALIAVLGGGSLGVDEDKESVLHLSSFLADRTTTLLSGKFQKKSREPRFRFNNTRVQAA